MSDSAIEPTGGAPGAGEFQFRALADAVPVVLWLAGPGGSCTFANRALLAFVGRPLEDCTGLRWIDAIHPDDRDAARAAFAGRGGFRLELRMRRHDGAWRRMLLTAVPRLDGPPGFVASAVEAQDHTSDVLAALIASIPDLVWVKDTEGRITLGNQSTYDLLGGGDPARVLGRDPLELIPDDADARRIMANDARILALGVPERVEETFGDPADPLVFQSSKAPLRDASGTVVGLVGVSRDVTAERRTEAALRESEADYRTLFENAGIANAELELPSGRFVRVNGRCRELLGYAAAELRGLTILDVTHPDDRERSREALAPVLRDHAAEHLGIDQRLVRKDGGVAWVHLGATLVRDAEGRPRRVVASAIDVTGRRRAEAAAREAEARLRFALEAGYLVAFDWDVVRDEVRRPYSNDPALPRTEEERPARFADVVAVVHPDDRERFVAGVRGALADPEGTYRSEHRVVRPDGTVRWLLEIGRAEFDAADRPIRLTGLSQDITDRRETDARMRETESTLRSFYENSPLMMGVVELGPDEDGEIVHLYDNPATARFFGRTPGGTRGQRSSELGARDAVRRLWRRHYRECERLGAPVHFEYRHPSPDAEVWLAVTVAHVGPSADGQARFSYVAEDVTSRKLAEHRLREEARRKDEFLATLAHELRNPLAPIRNAVQLLGLQAGSDARTRRALGIIDRQLSQMVRLIDDLLDVSRITRGKLELRREPVDVRAVLEAAVETSRPHLEAARHALAVDTGAEPLPLEADPVRLAQVFANLLNNAAKFTEPGGTLRVTARREAGAAVVTVQDSGVGFPPEHAERLFEMFMQAERPLDRAHGGLGIGLTLAKRIVELHGGTVGARSDGPGRGATFEVRLPVSAAVAVAPGAPPPAAGADGAAPGGCRVLVVDDNEDAAATLEALLQHHGFGTAVARDGVEAVEAAGRFRPDVVLLDLGMPRMNGYDAARAIRAAPWGREMVLVALTGWGQADDRRQSGEAGFDAHLVKPVELDALLPLLARATPSR